MSSKCEAAQQTEDPDEQSGFEESSPFYRKSPQEDTSPPVAKADSTVESGKNEANQSKLPKKYTYPEPWKDGPRVYMERPGSDSWATLQKLVEKYDREMCEGWKDDLDTILVFTGLFSAAVTAFCVESFNSLSETPADTTNALLLIISQQLSNSSAAAAVASSFLEASFSPAKSDVRINVLYFVSLALALSVSSVCILAKQWIREFRRDMAVSAHDALRVRQARYDGLIAWKVPQILAALPVILQAALLLFFAGLLVQLWNVSDLTTAIAVTVIVGILLSVVVFTTVVPGQRESHIIPRLRFAPFRSPQAWIFLAAWQRMHLFATKTWHTINRLFSHRPFFAPESTLLLSNWTHFDKRFIADENEHVERGNVDYIYDETSPFYNKEYFVSSSHCVLRWSHQVLRSVPQAEESIIWCMLNDDPPREIYPPTSLAHYVQDKSDPLPLTSELVCYEVSSRMRKDWLDSSRGRSQVEMLIRGGNQAISILSEHAFSHHDIQKSWSSILNAVNELNPVYVLPHHRIFSGYPDPDASRRMSSLFIKTLKLPFHQLLLSIDQEAVITQIALLLKNLFNTSTEVTITFTLRFDNFWHDILRLLFNIRDYGESAKSRYILDLTEDLVTDAFPKCFRNSSSVALIYHVAEATRRQIYHRSDRWSYGLRLFMSLDAILVQRYHHAREIGGGSGIDVEGLTRWHDLRGSMKETGDHLGRSLPENHFDVVNGPLPLDSTLEALLNAPPEVVLTTPTSALVVSHLLRAPEVEVDMGDSESSTGRT